MENLSTQDLELLKRKLELEKEKELEMAGESSSVEQNQEETPLTIAEEILAYPAAASKGVSLGLDKYIGGAGVAVQRAISGEDIGSPVEDYASMRDRLIRQGGVIPKTLELGSSMATPIKLAKPVTTAVNPFIQSTIYGATEGGLEGAALGAGIAAAVPVVGRIYKGAKDAISGAAELLGVDTKTAKAAIGSKIPLSTTQEVEQATKGANQSVIDTAQKIKDTVLKRKQEIGEQKGLILQKMDRQVGRSIPATEITGIMDDSQKIVNQWGGVPFDTLESQSMYSPIPFYTGLTSGADTMTMKEATDSARKGSVFLPESFGRKQKFIQSMNGAIDRINFPKGNKEYYKADLVNLAIDTDSKIQKEITRAMDGRVTQASSDKAIQSLENEFYNKLDAINNKHIGKLLPSELDQFKQEIYDTLNYGGSKITGVGMGGKVSLDVSPKGSMYKQYEEQLKGIGRRAKERLEEYASYHGHDLKGVNERYGNLSRVEELVPDAEDFMSMMDPLKLNAATERKREFLNTLANTKDFDLANMFQSSLDERYMTKKMVDAANSGVQGEGILSRLGTTFIRGGNLAQRKVYSPIEESIMMAKKVVGPYLPSGSPVPYAAGAAANAAYGRKPQSIEEVAYMKIPRSTEAAIASPELLIEKVKQLDPASLPIVQHAINEDPEKLPDVMFTLSQQFPQAFDNDKYGRFDGKIPSATMMNYISDLRNDGSISNTEKAKIMNDVLKKKIAHYDPQ